MTLNQALTSADALYPNTFPAETKVRWLSECEAAYQTDVLLIPAEDAASYTAQDGETQLLAPEAFSQMYIEYLCARICAHQQNSAGYENNMAMYNVTSGRLLRYMASRNKKSALLPAFFHGARSPGAH